MISSFIFLNRRSKIVCSWRVCLRPSQLNNSLYLSWTLQMRSSVVSLEHEVERLKEEIKEVETVRAVVFLLKAFCCLKHDLGLCSKSKLPKTSLQVAQLVLHFKNPLASGFFEAGYWILSCFLFCTHPLGLFPLGLSSLLLVDDLGLDSFLLVTFLKCCSLNLCWAISGFEMLSKCQGVFDRNY